MPVRAALPWPFYTSVTLLTVVGGKGGKKDSAAAAAARRGQGFKLQV